MVGTFCSPSAERMENFITEEFKNDKSTIHVCNSFRNIAEEKNVSCWNGSLVDMLIIKG